MDWVILPRIEGIFRLAGFLCTGIKGTAPGLLFFVVRRFVRCFVCKMDFAVGLVDVVVGGDWLTL